MADTAAVIRGCAAAAAEGDADAALLYEAVPGPTRQWLIGRLSAGVERAQIRADVQLHATVEAILSISLLRVLTRRSVLTADAVDALMDVYLRERRRTR